MRFEEGLYKAESDIINLKGDDLMYKNKYLIPIIFVLFIFLVQPFIHFDINPLDKVKTGETAASSVPADIKTPQEIPSTGTVEVGFSPNGNIEKMIIGEIEKAQTSIKIQAYSFTNREIAKELVLASQRGVIVQIILDKSQENEKSSVLSYLKENNLDVHIDRAFAIAHSKVFIIDGSTVITGSYNFTKSAEKSNSENCLILKGNQALTNEYLDDWQWRWNETN